MAYKILYDDAFYGTSPSCSIMISSESDLADLPSTIPTGSVAYTAGFQAMWQKGIDGTWVSMT